MALALYYMFTLVYREKVSRGRVPKCVVYLTCMNLQKPFIKRKSLLNQTSVKISNESDFSSFCCTLDKEINAGNKLNDRGTGLDKMPAMRTKITFQQFANIA